LRLSAGEVPTFVALSYTWGSPLVLHEIDLNGKKFAIRDNLWKSLNAILRHRNEDELMEKELRDEAAQDCLASPSFLRAKFTYFYHDKEIAECLLDLLPDAKGEGGWRDLDRITSEVAGRTRRDWDEMRYRLGSLARTMDDLVSYQMSRKLKGHDAMLSYTEWEYFWTDAICIDQTSVHERNHQVNMMRNIYAAAALVLVWLGERTADSDDAMEGLARSTYPSESKDALYSLMDNEYWKRVWIVQEIMMAREIIVACGQKRVSWESLKHKIWHTDQVLQSGEVLRLRGSEIVHEKLLRQRVKASGAIELSLDYLIERYYDQHCADPRDRVFALLGLVDTPDSSFNHVSFLADYNLGTKELFYKVVQRASDSRRLQNPQSWQHFQNVLRMALNLTEKDVHGILTGPSQILTDEFYDEIFSACIDLDVE